MAFLKGLHLLADPPERAAGVAGEGAAAKPLQAGPASAGEDGGSAGGGGGGETRPAKEESPNPVSPFCQGHDVLRGAEVREADHVSPDRGWGAQSPLVSLSLASSTPGSWPRLTPSLAASRALGWWSLSPPPVLPPPRLPSCPHATEGPTTAPALLGFI